MRLRRTHPADIMEICADLRPVDRDELLATRFSDDPADTGEQIAATLDLAVMALTFCTPAGAPVAFLGFWLIAPEVAAVTMFATPAFSRLARPIHGFCRDHVMGRAVPRTFRRVECRALASNATAHRWLRRLGFREEATLLALGKHGESFVQFAWVNPVISEGAAR